MSLVDTLKGLLGKGKVAVEQNADKINEAVDKAGTFIDDKTKGKYSDKIAQVIGGANQVAGPYFNHSAPEPSGVIAVVAPTDPLLGLVSVIAPVIVTGNTAVVVASEPHPLTSISSHPLTSKEFLISDCRGSVYLTDWRSDAQDLEGNGAGLRHSNLAELVEPGALAAACMGQSWRWSGLTAWRVDSLDM